VTRRLVVDITADSKGFDEAARRSAEALDRIAVGAKKLTEESGRADAGTAKLSRTLLNLGSSGASALAVNYLIGRMQALGDALLQPQVRAERLLTTLSFSVGQQRLARDINFLRDTTSRLGLQFDTAARAYARFAAGARETTLEGQGARQVFESIAKAAAVMGLSADETQGVFLALTQMISKGTVQAEELRGQLGERLPGAFQIAARAMGVTTAELSKMLEQGQVIAADFLPRFARQLEMELGEASERAGQRAEASINRVHSAWERLLQNVSRSGVGSFMAGQLEILQDAMNGISESIEAARDEGDGFFGQLAAGTGAVLRFLNPMNAFSYSAQTLDGKLQQAREELAELKAELEERGGGGFYLRGQIGYLEGVIAKLEQAKQAATLRNAPSLRQADNESLETFLRQEEEARQRRLKALGEVTSQLSGVNQTYMKSLQALHEAYQAGDISLQRYRELVEKLIKTQGGGDKLLQEARATAEARLALEKASLEREGAVREAGLEAARRQLERSYALQLVDKDAYLQRRAQLDRQSLDIAAKLVEAEIALERRKVAATAAEELQREARIVTLRKQLVELDARRAAIDDGSDDFDRAVAESERAVREEAMQRRKERIESATSLMVELRNRNRTLTAELIQDERERGRRLLQIEEETMRARLAVFAEGSQAREEAEQVLAEHVRLRNEQLNEQLKPGWQKLIEGWRDTTAMMRKTYNDFMSGFIDRGREAFAEWNRTGRVSARDLVGFIQSEMSRLAYDRFLAGGVKSIGDAIFSVFGAFHSGGTVGDTPPMTRAVDPAVFIGAPRYHNGGLVGDEVPIIARRGERVLSVEEAREYERGGRAVPKIEFVNMGTPQREVRREFDGDTLRVYIEDIVAESVASGGRVARALKGTYGLNRAVGAPRMGR